MTKRERLRQELEWLALIDYKYIDNFRLLNSNETLNLPIGYIIDNLPLSRINYELMLIQYTNTKLKRGTTMM
jgi:hypothetical protein